MPEDSQGDSSPCSISSLFSTPCKTIYCSCRFIGPAECFFFLCNLQLSLPALGFTSYPNRKHTNPLATLFTSSWDLPLEIPAHFLQFIILLQSELESHHHSSLSFPWFPTSFWVSTYITSAYQSSLPKPRIRLLSSPACQWLERPRRPHSIQKHLSLPVQHCNWCGAGALPISLTFQA